MYHALIFLDSKSIIADPLMRIRSDMRGSREGFGDQNRNMPAERRTRGRRRIRHMLLPSLPIPPGACGRFSAAAAANSPEPLLMTRITPIDLTSILLLFIILALTASAEAPPHLSRGGPTCSEPFPPYLSNEGDAATSDGDTGTFDNIIPGRRLGALTRTRERRPLITQLRRHVA